MERSLRFLVLGSVLLVTSVPALATVPAGIQPEDIHVAESRETPLFIPKGITSGGDRAIQDFSVRRIRRSSQKSGKDFDRIVLDLDGVDLGDKAPLKGVPYFYVGLQEEKKRVEVTLFGKVVLDPQLSFPKLKEEAAKLREKSLIEDFEILPVLEKDRWSFAIQLKKMTGVRAFYLENPSRIILDITRPK